MRDIFGSAGASIPWSVKRAHFSQICGLRNLNDKPAGSTFPPQSSPSRSVSVFGHDAPSESKNSRLLVG